MDSGFAFKNFNSFEVDFLYATGDCSRFSLLHVYVQFPKYYLLKRLWILLAPLLDITWLKFTYLYFCILCLIPLFLYLSISFWIDGCNFISHFRLT